MAVPTAVLFLDMDGVLILFNNRGVWNTECMKQLSRIIIETGATIVLSSNWKRSDDNLIKLSTELKKYGIEPPIHRTPELEYEISISYSRAKEIRKW